MRFNVRSSRDKAPDVASQRAAARLQQLDAAGGLATSERDKSINRRTRHILMASHAKGDNAISMEDRFYVQVEFVGGSSREPTDHKDAGPEVVFVNKHSLMGRLLLFIGEQFPKKSFGATAGPERALGLCTADSPDWRQSELTE